MKRKGIGGVLAATTAMVLAAPGVSGAAVGSGYVLQLELDETRGATTAMDSSGMGHHGRIGSHIIMGGGFADFDRHPPDTPPAYGFDHLITIDDAPDASLDPGTGNFSVEFQFRTRDRFGNIMQKGQSRTVGGQVKFQIPGGKLSCMFRTPQGMATATSGTRLYNDGVWHTARCDRTSTSVTLYVDGVRVGRKNGFTGNLNNSKPWTIGGKSECDQIEVTCDYFPGDIGYVRMTKG